MTSYLQKLHEKRKERLNRIKSAAFVKAEVDIKEIVVVPPKEPPPPPPPLVIPPTILTILNEDQEEVRKLGMFEIKRLVAKYFNVSLRMMDSEERTARIVWARHIYCHIVSHHLYTSSPKIGRSISRDHTSVLHAQKRIARLVANGDQKAIGDIKAINCLIENKLDAHAIVEGVNDGS